MRSHEMFHLPLQPTLTLEKDSMAHERPGRPSRHPKKKQRVQAEPELSESDEYVDFTEPRHESMAEFNTVIVGDETETSSAVQSIQQVDFHKAYIKFIVIITCPISFSFKDHKEKVLLAEVPGAHEQQPTTPC